MRWFDHVTAPTSYRNRLERMNSIASRAHDVLVDNSATFKILGNVQPTSSRPDFGHLTLLVFEAVLEVVCVSLPGYIVARQGMFDVESQKFLANLNVMLFTPSLIFYKLASQLTAEKMQELAIIPLIFIVQTAVSFSAAWIISTLLRLKKRQKSFVIAMGVFGNSNSLPISLVVSLSTTLSGLHWAKVPNDNDEEVGARGILYLLIFQQLGQLMRWTWGYNVLLAPADRFTEEEGGTARAASLERGRPSYSDEPSDARLLLSPAQSDEFDSHFDDEATRVDDSTTTESAKSAGATSSQATLPNSPDLLPTPANGNIAPSHYGKQAEDKPRKYNQDAGGIRGFVNRIRNWFHSVGSSISTTSSRAFRSLPRFIQRPLEVVWKVVSRFVRGVWAFMNPPLWAMLIAIVVATVPKLQSLFFDDGTFIKNSVTHAIEQNANVAVPLILVVLGGNLARSTSVKGERPGDEVEPSEERKLLIASLISRMLIPTLVMAPLLALTAKYVAVSILDDKIFIIVCFLLTGAPSALQLAQICQINNVYMNVMSKILFQSYVIWILPSTLVLVLLALETVSLAESK